MMATSYTLSELRLEVAENLGYDDGNSSVLTGKDVTNNMIDRYLNRKYYELVTMLMEKYPEDYLRVAYTDFWKTNSTISSITSTTLVAGAVFTNAMVGDTIYNSTQESSATIAEYTSSTTVELDAEPDDWAASDTIYVLGHEFSISGDAADSRYVKSVAVKYYTTDTYYRGCKWIGVSEVYRRGDERYEPTCPYVYKTNLKINDVFTPAIGIVPEPLTPIERGIKIDYLELPPKLSGDSDVPELPLGSQHSLIAGATADALKKLRRMDEVGAYLAEWQQAKMDVVMNYARSRVQNQTGQHDNNYLMRIRAK